MSTTREELPARLRAAYSEALTLLRIGRAASAERVLRDIQAAAPGEINSLRLLGVALLDQDKASDALLALEKVTAAAPEFWAARADLARAYRRAGRLEQARRELSRTVSAAPALESTWLAYGGCLPKLAKSSGFLWITFSLDHDRRGDILRSSPSGAPRACIPIDVCRQT
jgi:predicted Zn-dependent protease